MLPSKPTFFWQQLLDLLLDLQHTEPPHLSIKLRDAIALLEVQIRAPESEQSIAPDTEAKTRSYLTEIHRLLRLLQTDALFLQATRNSSTAQQRYLSCQQRLNQAIEFCQAAIALIVD